MIDHQPTLEQRLEPILLEPTAISSVYVVTVPADLWVLATGVLAAARLHAVEVPCGAGQQPRYVLKAETGARLRPAVGGPDLSFRELQVLHLAAGESTNAQIGEMLFLAEDTVKTHMRRLFRKLGVKTRAGAVVRGFELGILKAGEPS